MKIDASQSLSIDKFWLLVGPFLLFSLLSGFSNFGPYFGPHIVRSGGCLIFVSLPPDHTYPFGGFSFNEVNFLNHFQESQKLLFSSPFQ